MNRKRNIFTEYIIEDHPLEVLDKSIDQVDEYIWEDGYNGEINVNSEPNKYQRSSYHHDENKIIRETFNKSFGTENAKIELLQKLVINFDSKGNNSSTEIYSQNKLYCTWINEYDSNGNLILMKYSRNRIVQDKYQYDYDDYGNLCRVRFYTDNDSCSGNYFLDEERNFTYDANKKIFFESRKDTINGKRWEITYKIRKDPITSNRKFSILRTDGKEKVFSKLERFYNEELDVIAILSYTGENYLENSIHIKYLYDENGNWIERKVLKSNSTIISLRKRDFVYR